MSCWLCAAPASHAQTSRCRESSSDQSRLALPCSGGREGGGGGKGGREGVGGGREGGKEGGKGGKEEGGRGGGGGEGREGGESKGERREEEGEGGRGDGTITYYPSVIWPIRNSIQEKVHATQIAAYNANYHPCMPCIYENYRACSIEHVHAMYM